VREREEATGESGREEEERRRGGRGLLYLFVVAAIAWRQRWSSMVEPGALAGDGHRASGAGAEWAGGGARADLALGWRREEARARLVSGARAEWGGSGGAHADLALGHRREEAGTHSFFFCSAWVHGGGERGMRSGCFALLFFRRPIF
jgi:hypothetical protein